MRTGILDKGVSTSSGLAVSSSWHVWGKACSRTLQPGWQGLDQWGRCSVTYLGDQQKHTWPPLDFAHLRHGFWVHLWATFLRQPLGYSESVKVSALGSVLTESSTQPKFCFYDKKYLNKLWQTHRVVWVISGRTSGYLETSGQFAKNTQKTLCIKCLVLGDPDKVWVTSVSFRVWKMLRR